jgi:hypothetical protein
MLSLAIFGGNNLDGSELHPGEQVTALALFGGVEIDLTSRAEADIDLTCIAVFGAVNVKVRPEQAVRMTGFSLFGGRDVAPLQLPPPASGATDADDFGLPLEVSAYAVFGGVSVERPAAKTAALPGVAPAQ